VKPVETGKSTNIMLQTYQEKSLLIHDLRGFDK
jgi:hypothetical protein